MNQSSRVYVAGPQTLIGAALVREAKRRGFSNLVADSETEPDLTKAEEVDSFFSRTKPEYLFLAAGKNGGILANQKYPADFALDNLLIACHVIEAAHRHGVKKLLYLASSCSYPKLCPQPMREDSLLTGPIEPTNEPYAVAKIAGIKLCQAYRQQYRANFIVAIPANGFGPGDDFHPEDSHVIAAFIQKFHEAKEAGSKSVEIWGTGSPRREFVYVDDIADASLFVMEHYEGAEPINLGGGVELSIQEIAREVKDVVGFTGELRFDRTKPDGMPRKVLDSSKLKKLGWKPRTDFRAGLALTYDWFLENIAAQKRSRLDAHATSLPH